MFIVKNNKLLNLPDCGDSSMHQEMVYCHNRKPGDYKISACVAPVPRKGFLLQLSLHGLYGCQINLGTVNDKKIFLYNFVIPTFSISTFHSSNSVNLKVQNYLIRVTI